jgi:hypothetical protein
MWGPIIYPDRRDVALRVIAFVRPGADLSECLVVKPRGQEDEMRSALTWFLILAGVCIGGPYVLGVRPRARRDWIYLALTLAFLAWLLPLMISVRSR